MPTISPDVPNCVFYLYPTVEDAKRGVNVGGTGFFYSVELCDIPGHYYYAITNWHNIFIGKGAPVVRVNTNDGDPDIFELDHLDWHFKPGWYDLAVADVTLDMDKHSVAFVSSKWTATVGELSDFGIGLGSDVYMVGRFMDHDGEAINVPAVRFGNIAVMPQPVKQPTGSKLPSYILDLHSRTGFSGSPVFVFHSQMKFKDGILSREGSEWIRLLGVHWGQFPERWEIEKSPESHGPESSDEEVTRAQTADYVKGFSGMTLAVPAEAIGELLEMPELKGPREKAFADAREARRNDPIAESADPPIMEGNLDHREDFNTLLDATVAGKKRGAGK